MNEQALVERLSRIAKHHTGNDDIHAFVDRPEVAAKRQAIREEIFSETGDEGLADEISFAKVFEAYGNINEQGIEVNAHYLGPASGKNDDGEWEATKVLLPSGETRSLGTTALSLNLLSPVVLSGMNRSVDIGEGTTRYWYKSAADVSVAQGSHTDPIPSVGVNAYAASARKSRGKGGTIWGKARDAFVSGTIDDSNGSGIFVNSAEGDRPANININAVDDSGEPFSVAVSEAAFTNATGESIESGDQVRGLLAGRSFRAYGEFDFLATLNEERENAHATAIQQGWANKTEKGRYGKRYLKSPVVSEANGERITIQELFEGRNGLGAKADVADLGYTPTLRVGETSGTKDGRDWVMNQGSFIAFDGIEHGVPTVPAKYAGISAIFQKKLVN